MPEEIKATVKDLVSLYGSYEALARELGVSWVTVQRWIKGRTRPSPLAVRRIQDLVDQNSAGDS